MSDKPSRPASRRSQRHPLRLPEILDKYRDQLAEEWLQQQGPAVIARAPSTTEQDLRSEAREFITFLRDAVRNDNLENLEGDEWQPLIQLLTWVARKRLREGFPVRETGLFVSTFKEPLFRRLTEELGEDSEELTRELSTASLILDKLGLRIAEVYLEHREVIIDRQRQELLELSTPVVKIWEGVVALPLIGTLDSARTQIVMETLLESIVAHEADIAILDITGVPTVDTQVAQNLMKTVAAARLMGAECIISGIRPQIAQTIVQLGLSLENIQSRSSLADAMSLAFRVKGWQVQRPTER